MSLKLFHVVFVSCSSLLAFLFGGWALAQGGSYTVMGIAAFLVGVALIVYGVWFWRKIRTPEEERRRRRKLFTTVTSVGLLYLLCAPVQAHACSVCFGNGEGPMLDAARLGVWLLFGMVLAVQACFALFFFYLRRRSRRFHGEVAPWWTDVKESIQP